jgi:hypothetical protein
MGVFTAKIIAQNVEFQLGGKTNAEKFEITDSDGKVIFQLNSSSEICQDARAGEYQLTGSL